MLSLFEQPSQQMRLIALLFFFFFFDSLPAISVNQALSLFPCLHNYSCLSSSPQFGDRDLP